MQEFDVVILGAGFAGLACAERLERTLRKSAADQVLVVASENYFTFHALLPDVVGASLEPRHVIHPIRQILRHSSVRRSEVTAIDLEKRRVDFDCTGSIICESVTAKHLVLCMGSGLDMQAVPGMMEHALFLKTLADALELRSHIVRRLEEAVVEPDLERRIKLVHFVVVGGGFSGVETAGQMLDMLASAVRFYPELRKTPPRVTLVHSGQYLLPELDDVLGIAAQKSLEKRGLTVILNSRVSAVSSEYVQLKDGGQLVTKNVVCTIGNSPHPVLQTMDVEKIKGKVATDEFLRIKGQTNVWAIGDGAACPDGLGGLCAATGQFATRLGKHLGANLLSALDDKPLRPFKHVSVGQLASLGHLSGVCKINGWRFTGFLAWWMARTIHLMLLPGLELKSRVVLDWTLELFFPRNLNYLDLTRTEAVTQLYLQPGEILFRQGDPSHTFYVIEEGTIALTQVDAAGQTVFTEELHSGAHFGEGSLLRKEVRSTTAVAKTAVELLALGPRDFNMLFSASLALRTALQETSHRFRTETELARCDWPEEVLNKTVGEIMSQPVMTLPEGGVLGDAFQMLSQKRIGNIPLVTPEGTLSGLVTRSDMYRALADNRPMNTPLKTIASAMVQTIRPDQTVRNAWSLFRRRRLKHLPVVTVDGQPVGMLSTLDLALQALPHRT